MATLPRVTISYFDGVNTLVEHNISKKVEPEQAENARSVKIGSVEKRRGYTAVGDNINATANYGLFHFNSGNASSAKLHRISTVGTDTSVYYLNTSNVWTKFSGMGAGLTAAVADAAIAEDCCFIVNGTDNNRYIGTDGVTVVDSSTITGHLYNSPKARKINYYKDRLYLADYNIGNIRYKNSVMMSSKPLGTVALVDGDIASGTDTITVTDTKYIYTNNDSLDIYRGGTLITTITVTAKKEYSITISGTTSVPLLSSDEIWVSGTYGTAPRVFRWATNPSSGTAVKRYDTFKMGGDLDTGITMMTNIGDVEVIANKNSLMTWNDSGAMNYDNGIGCVSSRGYAKSNNVLFFVHYTGMYATTGGESKLMSSKVQDYFDGATKTGLENAAVGVKGLSIFAAIGDVTLYNSDGSVNKTLSDVCLELNMRQQNWFIHTNVPASQFSKFISTDPNKIVFSHDTNFKIYDFLSGTSDDNNEIPFSITTSNITLMKDFELFAYPRYIIAEIMAGTNGKCFVSLDDGPFYELKTPLLKGVNRIVVTPQDPASKEQYARCKKIRICIKEFSKGIFKVNRLALAYNESLEFETQSR